MVLKKNVHRAFQEKYCIFGGKFTYFGLGETVFIRLENVVETKHCDFYNLHLFYIAKKKKTHQKTNYNGKQLFFLVY
jgi:hypothetical protein